jgi:hypothetical protein
MTTTARSEIDCDKQRDHLGRVHGWGDTDLMDDDEALDLHEELHNHSHISIRKIIDPKR